MIGLLALVISVGFLSTLAFCVFRWRRRNLYAFAAKFKGPPEYPLFGSALLLFRKSSEERFKVITDIGRPTGEWTKIWFGPQLAIFVSEPADVQFLLSQPECLDKPYIYRFFGCDKGLFIATVNIWKDYRKLLNSTFNSNVLRNFISIFNDNDQILVEKMKVHLNKGAFAVNESVALCSLDNICATTLGVNMNIQNDSDDGMRFREANDKWLDKVNARIFNIFHHLSFFYKLSTDYRLYKAAYNECFSMTSKVIGIKTEEFNRQTLHAPKVTDDLDKYKKPEIYINQLLQLSKDTDLFDDQAIIDHIFTVIFGGHETSAFTVSNALVLLGIHQDIQEKVYAELKEVFFNEDEDPDFDLICKLEYMDMVIRETLRLFTPAPFIIRQATQDIEMSNNKVTIPKGVKIVVPIYNIHRDPKYWGPDADKFNPDNFLPENVKNRHPCSFIPFSAGPRVCLGSKYAMLSMKMMLILLLRKYKFHTPLTMDTIVKKLDITMKLSHDHVISIVPRKF